MTRAAVAAAFGFSRVPFHLTATEVKGAEMRFVVALDEPAAPSPLVLRNRKAKDSTTRRLEVLVAGSTAREFKSGAGVDFSLVLE